MGFHRGIEIKRKEAPVMPYVWQIAVLVVIEVAQIGIAYWIDQSRWPEKMTET